jgi:hypothetical protein
MPFAKTQKLLREILPQKTFDNLYNNACNLYDVYQRTKERVSSVPYYLYFILSIQKNEVIRIEIVQKVLNHTMVSKKGVELTYNIAYKALELDGCFVECGVARGGTSAVMAMIAKNEGKNRKMWMFDSYEGLPLQSDKDGIQKPIRHQNRTASDLAQGYCLGTFQEVDHWLFHHLELSRRNVFMIKGWFKDTLPQCKNKVGDIVVLRLDGDWYESTKTCLENLYDNVVKGGFIIIDDYHLQGCKLAVDEYIEKLKEKPKMINDIRDGRCYLVK